MAQECGTNKITRSPLSSSGSKFSSPISSPRALL
ncbi:Uncharacterised protein [Vibrio cholerae]|nr:Uncharacterised protein [Vibrio cholerae]